MSKRYQTGEHEIYDRTFIRLKNASQILGNANTGIGVGSVYNILWDRANLEAVRIEYAGEDKTGEYVRKGTTYMAKIPAIKLEIREFYKRWRRQQKQAINHGREIPSDSEMPENVLEERLLLEARLDIYREELAKIEERLKTFTDAEQDEDDQDVLKYGLIECGQLRGNVLIELDGQNLEFVNKVLVIVDKRSPYNGMAVTDYRTLAKEWTEERRLADVEHLKVLQATARKQNKPVPNSFNSFSGGRKVAKNLLPKWPDWAVNHLAETDSPDDSENA